MSNVIGSTPVNFDGDYNNLTNKPTIPTETSELNNDSGFITSASIPTATSDLTNDSGFITSSALPTATSDLTNDSGFITSSALPTATSDLTNDSGFITSSALPTATSDLTNDSGFITASSNINNTLIQTVQQEIIGDMTGSGNTEPQLYIRPSATSGRDTLVTLEGRRNNGNINSSYLKFTNFDDNDGAGGSTALMGMITGGPTNHVNNTGALRFYTSSTGSNQALCLILDSDRSATFYGDVTFSNTPKDSSNYSYITTHSTNTLLNKSFTYDSISDPPSIPSNTSDLNNNSGFITSSALPTNTSDLTNDSGFITSSALPTNTSDLTNDSGFITSSALPTNTSDLTNDSGFITSSALPTNTSDLTNDSGFITSSALPTNTSDLTNDSGFITSSALPTNTSDLTNDSGFITSSALPSGNELLPTVSSTAGQVLEVYEVSSGVYGRRWVDLPSIPSGNELLPTLSSTAGQVLEVFLSGGVYGRRWVDLPSIPTIPSGNELLPTLSSTAGQVLEVYEVSSGVYGRRWVDLPTIPSGNELLPTVSSTAGQVLEVYEVSSGVYGRQWVDLPTIPSGNELLPTLSSTAGQVLEVYEVSSGVYGRRWVDLPTIPSGNELLPTLSSTAGQVLEVYEVSSGVYGRRWVDLPSIPSGNELLPTLSSTAGQVLEVYEVSSGVYGRRWVDLPVVDTSFNRFSTNACDSVALYGKIAQVSSDTYQEVLTELQYTGGGLGAAAYLSANLGDFTNNVGFITTLPSNLPNFNETLSSSITDGKLLRVGQDSNNNKVIKYESDTNKLVPDITTDGYFLRSDIAGTTQSLTWAEIPSIPTNSPNFNESLSSSITDGKFLRVGQDSNNNKVIKYDAVTVIEDLTSYTQPEAISLDSTGSTITLKTDSVQRMIIDENGDVGINVAAPSEKLDVDGNINVSGSFNVNGTANQALAETSDITVNTITSGSSTGKAKIGTLHGNGACFANSALFANHQYALFHNNSGETNLNAMSGQFIGFRISNVDKMRLISNGNFGIGLTNPSEKLEVSGTVKATDFKFALSGGGTYLTSSLYSGLTLLDSAVGTLSNTVNNLDIPNLTSFSQTAGIHLTSTANSIKFQTGPTLRLEVKNDGDIAISNNLQVTGTATCSDLTFTNGDGGTTTTNNMLSSINSISSTLNGYGDAVDKDTTSVVSSGSADLVTSGGVYTAIQNITISSTRQVVGTFNKHVNVDTDITGGVPYIVWDTTVSNSNGITHTSGSVVPNNSLFNVIETGLYIFNILIPLENKNASGRSYVGCDIQVYTGSSLSSRGGQFMTHPISTVYVRGNAGNTNTSLISGTVTIHLEAGKQFEFMGRTVYQTNTNCRVECQNGTSVKIERIVYSQTVVSSTP